MDIEKQEIKPPLKGKHTNISGYNFGLLTVIDRIGTDNFGHSIWKCTCDCGNITTATRTRLNKGYKKSCGCLLKIISKAYVTTHGCSKKGKITAEYNIWCQTKSRSRKYKIPICSEWKYSFVYFLNDVGNKPSVNHRLIRINKKLGFTKENCFWQLKNKSVI